MSEVQEQNRPYFFYDVSCVSLSESYRKREAGNRGLCRNFRLQYEVVKFWVALYFRCNVSDRIELHHADVRE